MPTKTQSAPNCPLCKSDGRHFSTYREIIYLQCVNCKGIFMHPKNYISRQNEKLRYETHNNDVNDPHYQNFVMPIVNKVKENHTHESIGLDYGAGPGPVITKLLRDSGYKLNLYDPYFEPNWKALEQSYDYIVCCEVMEHFSNPYDEFKLLHSLLNPGGDIYCMTSLFDESINFEKWYYKNDITHLFFYHRTSLEWIKENLGFKRLDVKNKLITFSIKKGDS